VRSLSEEKRADRSGANALAERAVGLESTANPKRAVVEEIIPSVPERAEQDEISDRWERAENGEITAY
jgi:hypothetical protein